MYCSNCQGKFVYTMYIRVMRRSEKSHRSRQTWQASGLYCMNCRYFVDTLPPEMRKSILARRVNQDRQISMGLDDTDIG